MDIIGKNCVSRNRMKWKKMIIVFVVCLRVCIQMSATIIKMKETLLHWFYYFPTKKNETKKRTCDVKTFEINYLYLYASVCGSFTVGQRNLFNCGYTHLWLNSKKREQTHSPKSVRFMTESKKI